MYSFVAAKRIVFLLTSLFLVIACKKGSTDDPILEPPPVIPIIKGKVSGNVVLPAGSTLDLKNMTILGGKGDTTLNGNKFTIDTVNFTTHFLINNANQVFMMAYNHSDQTSTDITPQSTAIALIMLNPSIGGMSIQGKQKALRDITTAASYNKLVEEITNVIRIGKSITDPANIELLDAYKNVLTHVSKARFLSYNSKPIDIKTQNNIVSLTNNTAAYFVAGIYKDGERVSSLTLNGATYLPTSLVDMYNGAFGNGYTDPHQEMITMETGKYEIKIRSGKPGTVDGQDALEAQKANIMNASLDMLVALMPYLKTEQNCLKNIGKRINTYTSNELSPSGGSTPEGFGMLIFEFLADLVSTGKLFNDCLFVIKEEDLFKITKASFDVNKFFSKVWSGTTAGNLSAQAYHLINSNPSMDTCFLVAGIQSIGCGYQLGDAGGASTPLTIDFENQEVKEFKIIRDGGTPPEGIDYSKVTFVPDAGSKMVTLKLTSKTNTIAIQPVSTSFDTEEVLVDVLYKGIKIDFQIFKVKGMAIPGSMTLNSGNNQTGDPNARLTGPLIVNVKNVNGQPMAGVSVTWTVVNGGGELTAPGPTGPDGISGSLWKLGPSGTQTATASVKKPDGTHITGSPVTFTATLKNTESVSIVSGNNQSGAPNTTLTNPLVISATSAGGFPAAGLSVTWSVSGGGSVSSVNTTTGLNGQSFINWRLGTTGPQNVTVSVRRADGTPVTGSPITFTATITTATIKEPNSLWLVSGDAQLASLNSMVTKPLVVLVKDGNGQPLAGINVTWEVTAGGGQVTSAITSTDANGYASNNTWRIGEGFTQDLTASVKKSNGTHVGGSPFTFRAFGLEEPSKMEMVSGSGQIALPGSTLDPVIVRVIDQLGTPMPNIEIHWKQYGSKVKDLITYTNKDGLSSNIWTLGTLDAATFNLPPNKLDAKAVKPGGTFINATYLNAHFSAFIKFKVLVDGQPAGGQQFEQFVKRRITIVNEDGSPVNFSDKPSISFNQSNNLIHLTSTSTPVSTTPYSWDVSMSVYLPGTYHTNISVFLGPSGYTYTFPIVLIKK